MRFLAVFLLVLALGFANAGVPVKPPTAKTTCKPIATQKTTAKPTSKPRCSGVNEVYSDCGNNGCQNTCANPNIAVVCKAACKSGCICAKGYLRNSKGVCVVPEKCDTCSKPNEVFVKCANDPCANTCEEPNRLAACTSTPINCKPGCICAEGFLRDTNTGDCIPEKECICEDPNARTISCPSPCPGGTCSSPEFAPCRAACRIRGCQCRDGYVKDDNTGVCTLLSECPADKCANEPNTVFSSCGDTCPNTCANKDDGPRACPAFCFTDGGCVCKEGYVRDENGKCILPEDCPPNPCLNEPNTVFVPCGDICPVTCDNKDSGPLPCPEICKLGGGCRCKDGYVRDANGKCIPADQCPANPCLNEPNTVFAPCGDVCPVTCENKDSGPLACPAICKLDGGCRCKDGYVRDANGKCISADQCPPNPCLNEPNTEFVKCGDICPVTCDNKDSGPLPCPKICKVGGGCRCKNGYVRDANGKCILAEQCPSTSCKDPNEVFSKSKSTLSFCNAADEVQNSGCSCKAGFYYKSKKDKTCIKKEKCCDLCTDVNEEYSRNGPCEGTCSNRSPKSCSGSKIGCFCKKGFVRDNGKCINPIKCKKSVPY